MQLAVASRMPAADPPKNFSGFQVYGGLGWEKKTIKFCSFGGHFGHCLADFCSFWMRAKSQNTVMYSVFVPLAWKKNFLQHAENCVNTNVFACH